VDIIVRGDATASQRLTGIIRENFARIHADLKELNPIELMEVGGQPGLYQHVKGLESGEFKTPVITVATAAGDVEVNRTLELNRLTPEMARRSQTPPLHLFVSYAHKNEKQKDALGVHLDLLRNEGLIEPWDDRRIVPGQGWDNAIRKELEAADVIVFLVTTPFLGSNYSQTVEVKRAIEHAEAGKAVIIPIILEKCTWRMSLGSNTKSSRGTRNPC
jgi:hypothetical protein